MRVCQTADSAEKDPLGIATSRTRTRGRTIADALGAGDRWLPAALVGTIGLACGLSPLLNGLYSFPAWGVIAIAMLAVGAGLVLAGREVPGRLARVALGAVIALAVLSVLSLAWAESADSALLGASRWILYASTFAVLMVAMRSAGVARVGLAAATAGIAAVAVYQLAVMIGGDGSSLFFRGRLYNPLGAINTQGLFMLLGIWPLLGLAQYARPVVAGPAAGGATALAALAFLSQSRSVALAFAVAALAALALLPGRLARAWLLLVVVGAVAAIASPLIDVYDAGRLHRLDFDAAIRSAAVWIVVSAAVTGAVWGALVAGWRRAGTPSLRRAGAIALGAVALAGVGVLAASAGSVRTYVDDQARAFTSLQRNVGRARVISGGGNRYDYWRIALHEFGERPVAGVGVDNYSRDYYIRRSTNEDIRQPHSIAFQTLAELGALGAIALGVFLAAVALGAIRRARRRPPAAPDRVLLVGTVGAFSAWLGHAAVDWPHLVPGAMGIALLAGAYLVTGPGAASGSARRMGRRRVAGIAIRGLAVVGLVVGVVTVGRALLAVHYVDRGKETLAADPARAIRDANNALAFNGDSVNALYLKSAGYGRLGDYSRARAALFDATRREPHNFVPWALLGDLAASRDDLALARRAYTRAYRLNPRHGPLRDLSRNPQP